MEFLKENKMDIMAIKTLFDGWLSEQCNKDLIQWIKKEDMLKILQYFQMGKALGIDG
jgi:hypothetical protein